MRNVEVWCVICLNHQFIKTVVVGAIIFCRLRGAVMMVERILLQVHNLWLNKNTLINSRVILMVKWPVECDALTAEWRHFNVMW